MERDLLLHLERDLLFRFKSAREFVDTVEEALKAARAEEREAEAKLIEYLEGKGASATAKYDGVGWCQINKPTLYASANAEALPQVLTWLREHGHESAIKATVHHSTLSQIVSEQLQEGAELPPGVTYFLKPNVRLYGGSNGN